MKLIDVCEINPRQRSISDDTLVSFVAMPDVSEDGKINTSVIRPFSEVKKGYTVFQEGDILFAKITPCMENGKGALAVGLKNGIGVGSTEFHVLRPNPGLVNEMWVYNLTAWTAFRHEAERHMTGSAGQKRVPKSFLEEYTLSVPSLNTQREQVEHLNRVNQIIEARKEQLKKLDELVKARFVEMFGEPHKSKTYPYIIISELTDVISGGTPDRKNADYWNGGTIPWVKTTELRNKIITEVEECITEKGLSESSAKIVPENSILIAMYGQGNTRGMTGFLGIKACTNQACACLLPTDNIDMLYLWQFLILSYNELRDLAQGGNQPNLNARMIKNFPILVPPLAKQKEFARFVSILFKLKMTIEACLGQLNSLKQSLMHLYFENVQT